jgi:2',3'-cyclic-nucleotide 2'-phosphodiesterase / 3'-nucleotidase
MRSIDPTRGGRTRRLWVGGLALVTAVAVAIPAAAAPSSTPGPKNPVARANHQVDLTIMATTDVHGYALNWDYFNNREFTGSSRGSLSKVSTLVNQIRADRGAEYTMLLDNGDTIQGSSLAQYFAKVEPITETGETHPMAMAMNAMKYDAMVVGNHEFNYGIPYLRTFESQLRFPLLGANVTEWETDVPAFTPYVIKKVMTKGNKPVRVGVLGLTTPGSAIWDKGLVTGVVSFGDAVAAADKYVPMMRKDGAELVIVLAHGGANTGSSYGDALPYLENFARVVAETVPGIDAIVAGHSHSNIPGELVTNVKSGEKVLLTQPGQWGRRLSVMDFDLEKVRGKYRVMAKSADTPLTAEIPEDPMIVSLLADAHQATVAYVNTVIGTSLAAMSLFDARYRDVAGLDFINYVQTEVVKAALAGTPHASLPVLSIAAPFSRTAGIPAGDVTIADVAGMYIYDNTMLAIILTGAQLKDYLERSAQFFKTPVGPGPYTPDDVSGVGPDYNYDVISGLTYDIDIAMPAGSRIKDLSYGGLPIDPSAQFAVAINNYRQNGGGNFPHVVTAPIIWNELVEIRESIIEWVKAAGVIDPVVFATVDWKLVMGDDPVVVIP